VFALLVCTVLALYPVTVSGQEARGTITGRITDANKAVVPGASVTITNVAMGIPSSVLSNDVGWFQAPYLIPGGYQVVVEVPGFKKYIRDGIVLRVNDTLEVNVQLEVGEMADSITVTANTPLLESTSASMGQVVDERRVAELPIPHGEPYALIGLAGGVAFARDQRLDRPFEPTHIVGYTMDGTRANRSDITIDGAPATATANANEVISSYVPPADIVQEFKVQTATFDASFGNTEGGVTNLSLKSGTNAFHGTAYYTKMLPGLFANDFFANANKIPRPDFNYNRWGGSLGGPVILPKLYDGRNKTFFMWGYEGIKEARPRNNGTPTIPTEKMKNGDFSELLAVGSQYQIYNPFTRRAVAGGRFQQDPFPGNIIPANLVNPVSRKLLEYFPKPLTAGNPDGTNNFQNPSLKERANYYTHTVRVDHALGDKQRLFIRGSVYPRNSDYNNFFGNIATGEWFQFLSRAATIDDVYTLNATTVLNVRYGYNRFIRVTNSNPGNRGMDLTTLGFPASYASSIPEDIRRFPRLDITGYQGTGQGGEFRPNDTHSFVATINKVLGVHSLRSGLEFRSYRETDSFFANNQTGQFNFDATWTRGPLDNSPTAPGSLGQSFASFLLGLPSSGLVVRAASYAEQSTSWGLFIQDDWKVSSKLTLNIGLRYELEGPLTERFNRTVRDFDFNAAQPIESQVKAKYALSPTPEIPVDQFRVRGGLRFVAVGGQPRGAYDTPKENFMPRFGFACKLDNRTVVRGGYGIFFGFLGQRRGDVIQSGFSATTNLVPTLDNGLTFIETLSKPFQNGIQEPVGAALGPQTFLGQGITFFYPSPLSPYMQRWELGFQRELPGGFVAGASYVGNRGTHIEISRNLNVTPQKYLSKSPVRDQTTINYLSANVPNPFFQLLPATAVTALRGTNIARERLLRPYPAFDSVTSTTNDGYSWYHSLQAGIEKRFSKGYTLMANYTLSKFMQATELLNADDPRPTEVISDMDYPHRLSVSGIYELPFGKARQFLHGVNPFVSKIVSGWQVSGIYAYQSGPPINWGNIIFTGKVKDIRLPSDQQAAQRWFNTNAGFEKDSAKQLASNVRTFPQRFGSIRADNISNYDLSIIKNTEIAEGKKLQFRSDFINAFNHPLFPAPNVTPTAVAFGSISPSNQSNYPRRIQLTAKFLF
jgi:hypothetical protein